eukprot:CAMPEP_0179297998 /NCGR_PEP_ID=MMETSP0797-20121207/45760_1 /TAXON_ID=47934 /ORGANISM="Dinophysis acuminata, Strain DAEP01" /LENGTH=131 /DNA_ID=CAMNT_0021007359 /DNA_START=87 /DNA_END=478 /DNA_ORIENTATION=-
MPPARAEKGQLRRARSARTRAAEPARRALPHSHGGKSQHAIYVRLRCSGHGQAEELVDRDVVAVLTEVRGEGTFSVQLLEVLAPMECRPRPLEVFAVDGPGATSVHGLEQVVDDIEVVLRVHAVVARGGRR